jgi:tetratricopeptide (TPR) repeat protein
MFFRTVFFVFLIFYIYPIHSDPIPYDDAIRFFPIDLSKDWFIHEGDHHSISKKLDWKKLDELPLSSESLKITPNPEDPFSRITACKQFLITSGHMKEMKKDAISLHLAFVVRTFKVFLNGKEILAKGEIKNNQIRKSGFQRNLLTILPEDLIHEGENQICLSIASYKGEELDIYKSTNDLTNRIHVHSANLESTSERVTLMLNFLYLGVGLYHLLLFAKRPREIYNFYFSIFCIFLFIYIYTRSNSVYELNIDPLMISKVEYAVLFQFIPLLLCFFESLYFSIISKPTKALFYTAIIEASLSALLDYQYMNYILKFWQISMLVFFIYIVYINGKGVMQKNIDAIRLSLGFFIMATCAMLDLLGALVGGGKNLGLLRYGFFVFVMGIAVVLANRFLRVYREVEDLNSSLELKVKERTQKLQESFDEIQALKEQQDGDYFLTSLLLEPLGVDRSFSKSIKADSYLKQKKTFEFRGRYNEIGGDINIADSILLKGKNYFVFVNGDAMGKSIQGAGGALVLGVVFQSVLTRTKIRESEQNKTPERWLKECFLELHNVFESFEGSMLISVVMGLIDEETGYMYYMNAEHPWTVLYRDGNASFIEDNLELRKIGTMGMSSVIRVKTFPLQKGDIIFLGSDGRDDIIMSESEGERVINEDETQFLRRIEEAKGDMENVVNGILNFGKLSDDLSLLRIEYNPVQVLSVSDQEIESEFKHIKSFFVAKNFKELIATGEKFIKSNPNYIEVYYYLACSHKMLGNFAKASDYGETVRLRDPNHVRNLLNLADNYRLTSEPQKAKKLIPKIRKLDPNNPFLEKLETLLSQK